MKNKLPKLSVILFVIIVKAFPLSGQSQGEKSGNISTFIKVWGFLKYHHPFVAQGKMNWDSLFVTSIGSVSGQPPDSFNHFLDQLLQKLGNVDKCLTCQPLSEVSVMGKRNLTIGWLYTDPILSPPIKSKLQYIRENRHQGESHYVKYVRESKEGFVELINESDYADSLLLKHKSYRLLSLARYWNAVEYFFAYKYLLTHTWDSILWKYVPLLEKTMDLEQYHLIITRLTREVEDGHAVMGNSRYLMAKKWSNLAPFGVTYLNGKTMVSEIRYEQLNKVNDIKRGDIILKIDNVTDKELREKLYPYFKGSNQALTQGTVNNMLFSGTTGKVKVLIERDGKQKTVEITRYPFKAFWDFSFPPKKALTLKEHCALVDLGSLQQEQIDSVMTIATRQKAIIFDLRNYPQVMFNYLMKYLTDEYKPWYKGYNPTLYQVGVFELEKIEEGKLDTGKVYKGIKVILVNEFTQSLAEFTAMYFQSLPNTVVMGSQTAGTDGNITQILLPGNIHAIFSNVLIEYPDGTQCQKKGIKLDYVVIPTEEDIKKGRDKLVAYALDYCLQQDKSRKQGASK